MVRTLGDAMQPGTKSRTISLFIGSLRIPVDASLLQSDYDEFHARLQPDVEDGAPRPPFTSPQAFDDLDSQRSPGLPVTGVDPWNLIASHGFPWHFTPPPPNLHDVPLPHLAPLPHLGGGGGGGGEDILGITVTYQSGGDQMDMRVEQVNNLRSDDVVTGTTDGTNPLWPSHPVANFQSLEQLAANQTPDHLAGTHDTPEAITAGLQGMASDHLAIAGDASLHLTGSDYSYDSVTNQLQPGLFIDGQSVDPASPQPTNPDVIVPAMPTDTHANMAVIEAGSNIQVNSAELLNAHGPTGTLVVMGDSYKSDAIVQTNVLVDHSAIVGTADSATLQAGDNAANNVANFINAFDQNPYAMGLFSGLNWHVDTVSGNFYDVKLGTQFNSMTDNDLVSHTSTNNYSFLETGGNQQGNLLTETNINSSQYDLVVVGGNYYNANWLFQTNVLLNSDYVSVTGGNGQETVSTGANWLLNSAVIADYSTGLHGLTPELQAIASALQGGEQTLDLNAGMAVPGNGSMELNVLFVTGNYYDYNVLQQTNVMNDSDTVMQQLGPNEAGYVSTGSNQLVNGGAIVELGPLGGEYVGGNQYSESILVQSNIISQTAELPPGQSSLVLNDPTHLAPEAAVVIAQLPAAPAPAPDQATTTSTHSDSTVNHTTPDPLSSVLS